MWARESLVDGIERLLDVVQHGSGGALFVVGEAGLGKTTALNQARHMAGPGVRMGAGRGHHTECRLSFGLLAEAVESLGGPRLDLADQGRAVSDNRSRVFHRVLRWLEGLAPEPALLALDDLHWADPDSLDLLAFLCRRVSSLPVAVIATLRPWPPAAEEVAMAVVRSGHAYVERLGPLNARAAGEVLAARVGRPVREAVVTRAHAACAGNPLLLEHLAPAIAEGDDLVDLAATVAALGLDRQLLRRFAALGPAELRFAQAASVLGICFDPQLAAEVARLDDREVDGAVEGLWHRGLVRKGAKVALEFVHPLVRQVLYEALSPPQRARLHSRAFTALAAQGAEAEAVQHGFRGDLVGAPEVVGAVERAGRAALREGSTATALELLEAGVQLAAEHATPGLVAALAEALLGAGRPADAITASGQVLSGREVDLSHRLEALRTLGRALFVTGAQVEGTARFEEVVGLAHWTDCKAAAVGTLVDHALAAWPKGGPAHTLPLTLRARELATETDEVMASRAAWSLLATLSGHPTEGTMRTACLLTGQGPPSLPSRLCRPWGTVGMLGMAAAWTERFDEAEKAFGSALEEAERLGRTDPLANLAIGYPYLLCRMGRLNEAQAIVDRVGALAQPGGLNEAYVDVAQAWVLHQVGCENGSEEYWARAQAGSAAAGEWAAMFLWDAQAQRLVSDANFSQACELYGAAEEATKRLGIGELCAVPWVGHAVGAYLGCGRGGDASRVVEWVESCVERVACRWPRIVAARGRAGLAEHEGDQKTAADHLQQAMVLHEQVDLPLERIETLLHYGAFLRRSGEGRRARPVLGEALRLAEDCQAGWLGDRARVELGASGGRRRGRSGKGQLTPAEQRVAQLAAAGRSNREIAGHLVVSVATVETHLQHIYTKLGIHSRRQLMSTAEKWGPSRDEGVTGAGGR